jgi:hypothetical protein
MQRNTRRNCKLQIAKWQESEGAPLDRCGFVVARLFNLQFCILQLLFFTLRASQLRYFIIPDPSERPQ